ncbi:leucine-rich repeat extensin-like protein 5 [Homarus americanus]|uniref:leucine-rich repeat extensin-like protein 5 n=1 Tax=Homarus americanus TaxID=6706 RepID=UPI001C46BDC5|nr:leucine-rich repeat extensin-like protein 5 [Homarus americanus]
MSSLAARPAHVLHSASYKYSLDVPRVNLREMRSNTYPPPGTDGSSPSQSSSTSGGGSGGSQNSPSDLYPPLSPRLSPGGAMLVLAGRMSPQVPPTSPASLVPPHSPGPRSSLSSSVSSSCATSPVPRLSPVPRSPVHASVTLAQSAHTSPSPAHASPSHTHASPMARGSPVPPTRSSPTPTFHGSPVRRKSVMSDPGSPMLRRTTRPPLQRSHATAGKRLVWPHSTAKGSSGHTQQQKARLATLNSKRLVWPHSTAKGSSGHTQQQKARLATLNSKRLVWPHSTARKNDQHAFLPTVKCIGGSSNLSLVGAKLFYATRS